MTNARRPNVRGPGTPDYDFRTKKGVFEWGGHILDGNEGGLPENRPRLLINGRLHEGAITPRGGQETFADFGDANACVRMLVDFQVGTRRSLMIVGNGCPGFSPVNGYYIGIFDHEQSPEVQRAVYYNTGTVKLITGKYGDKLYIGRDDDVLEYQPIFAPYGSEALTMVGPSQDIPLFSLPAGFTSVSAMQEFDGLLFMACVQGVGTSKVISWDGLTERDDVASINAPTGFGLYRESLIMGFAGAPNEIHIRAVGDSPGTWTTVAPGAGTAAFKRGISYKDVFYFTTGAEDLFSYNGSVLTRIPIATSGIAAGSITEGIAVFNGYLYVSYTAAGNARIARFDGTTWAAIHKNLTTQFGADLDSLGPMVEYRGNLIVAGDDNLLGGGLYVSPGTATTGTWTRKDTQPGVETGAITELVLF
jgi:hypothetical protein